MATAHKPRKTAVKSAKASEHTVSVNAQGFSPATISVKVGETVTFKNDDTTMHTVSFDSGNSYEIPPGETHDQDCELAGNWTYHCNIHPDMKGTVVVS